jgi:hypothetical protein
VVLVSSINVVSLAAAREDDIFLSPEFPLVFSFGFLFGTYHCTCSCWNGNVSFIVVMFICDRRLNRAAQTGVFDLDIRISNRPFFDACKSFAAETGLKSRNFEKRINAV